MRRLLRRTMDVLDGPIQPEQATMALLQATMALVFIGWLPSKGLPDLYRSPTAGIVVHVFAEEQPFHDREG